MNKEVELKILEKFLLIRRTEEKIAKEYSKQEMRCPTHLCIGQELVSAISGVLLDKEDKVVSSHR